MSRFTKKSTRRRSALGVRLASVACTFIAVAAIALGPASMATPAQAASVPAVYHQIVINQAAGEGYRATLTVTPDEPVSASIAGQIESTLEGVMSASPSAAPGFQYLPCNQLYTHADTWGTYTFQHACGGTTGPWGYAISPLLCSFAYTPVAESGMGWLRNGVPMPLMAPHQSEPCGYQYHGTFNPEYDYDQIQYFDEMTFQADIGVPTTVILDIYGKFYSAPTP
jgi:hypothetical protein